MEHMAHKKKMGEPENSQSHQHSQHIPSDEQNLSALLKQYISVQSNMMDLKGRIRELSVSSRQIETKIIDIMNTNNLQNIDTQNSIIRIKTTTVKKIINQELLTNFFVTKLNIPPTTIKQFVDQLPSKTTQSLSIKIK